MKILNISCGAVGAYFCGRLAEQGTEVAVTVRSDRELIADRGFDIKSIAGDFIFRPQQVLNSADEYHDQADYIIITSKVLPEADMVKLIGNAVKADSVIVLIQNGIGIEKALAEAYPNNELISAVAYIGVSRIAPGVINHQGAGKLILGKFGGGPSKAAKILCNMFAHASVPADYTEDIAFYRWKKLLWNIPFNIISVLGGGLLTNEMTDSGELEKLCANLMREVIATAHSCQINLPESLVQENIEYTRNFPPYKTSMLIDCENLRPLEVDAIAGEVVKIARANRIPTPCLETVFALLQAFDRHRQYLKTTNISGL